uniref:Uncharacterized protein n=1 Tax=Lotharella globosa TaxID=91324 RepID=A0A6U3B2H8_9EUKA|mmetsp:Transcript_28650/g.55768  ORF Transcript_28650/g.55768 Transcript_28650/m.55768 type:complete len:196 (+) Transcript_28650:86-673(+)
MRKSVSFNGNPSPTSTVKRSPVCKSILKRESSECSHVIETLAQRAEADVRRAWRRVTVEKFVDPWNLIQGEVVQFRKDGEKGVSWMFSWNLLTQVIQSHKSQSSLSATNEEALTLTITKRGHLVAELLRRGQRDLMQKRYLNPILQSIYDSLEPALKKKTDCEWSFRRQDVKKSTISCARPRLLSISFKRYVHRG